MHGMIRSLSLADTRFLFSLSRYNLHRLVIWKRPSPSITESGLVPEISKGVARTQEICMLRDEFLSVWKLHLTGGMGLLRTLQFASHRRASISHDYVYGLRSLLPTNEQDLLQPNYDISIRELYASVIKTFLNKGKSISFLCGGIGTSQPNEHNLPSRSLLQQAFEAPCYRGDDPLKEQKELTEDDASGSNILRLQGINSGAKVTAAIPKDTVLGDLVKDEIIATFLARDIYAVDRTRRSPYNTNLDRWETELRQKFGYGFDEAVAVKDGDDDAWQQMVHVQSIRYVVFRTDRGSFGKCANDVQQVDEI
jgi:hypothetical protein